METSTGNVMAFLKLNVTETENPSKVVIPDVITVKIRIDTSKLKASNVGKKAFKGLGVNKAVVIKVPGNKYKKYRKIIKMSGIGKKLL